MSDANLERAIQLMGTKPVNQPGMCFDAAAHQFVYGENPDGIVMVHGTGITNMPGEEGRDMGHAWLEFDYEGVRYAYDAIWGVARPVDKYRRDLQVGFTVTYELKEFVRIWTKKKYPGPWNDRILNVVKKYDKMLTSKEREYHVDTTELRTA